MGGQAFLLASVTGLLCEEGYTGRANEAAATWGLIKRSLQGVMYSVTIRLGLNPSAKDRRWSSRKKLFFSRKISR